MVSWINLVVVFATVVGVVALFLNHQQRQCVLNFLKKLFFFLKQFLKSFVAKRTIIIDGNNVAFRHSTSDPRDFSADGIIICIDYFKNLGFDVIAVVPNFRVRNDDRLGKLLKQRNIHACKNTENDDLVALRLAVKKNGAIISNDLFREFLENGNEAVDILVQDNRLNRVGFKFAKGKFVLGENIWDKVKLYKPNYVPIVALGILLLGIKCYNQSPPLEETS